MKVRPFSFLAPVAGALCALPAEGTDKTGGLAPVKRPEVALYASVLQKYVKDNGRVDYAGLRSGIAPLAGFVVQ
jgi:hypothetical protein